MARHKDDKAVFNPDFDPDDEENEDPEDEEEDGEDGYI